jgi:hypothetical protein
MSDKLGDMLLEAGIITKQQLDSALDYQKAIGGKLGVILVKLNFVKEDRLAEFLSRQMKIPIVRLKDHRPDPAALSLVPRSFAERHEILPLSRDGETLTVVTPDPTDYPAIDELAFTTRTKVQTVLATRTEVYNAIRSFYGGHGVDHATPLARPVAPTLAQTGAHHSESASKRGRAGASPAAAPEHKEPLPARTLDVSGEKLARALAGLLVERQIISLAELMEYVAREGQGDRG